MPDAAIRSGPILSESRRVRYFSFFLFYVSQGLPYGLTTKALPVWIAINGGSAAQVASIIAMAYLPWSWKFIVAALVDRYTWLPMGRRRVWLILAQVLMSAGFVAAAVLAPGPEDIDVLLVVTFLVMTGGAMQDVTVDALAVDILPEREQGTASALMFGGQALGGAITAAGAAASLQYLGSATTFLLFIPLLLVPTIYAIFLRERPGERRFPWSAGAAAPENLARVPEDWLAILKVTVKSLLKGPSLIFLAAQSFVRAGGGLTLPMWPLLATSLIGMDETAYGGMSSTLSLLGAVIAMGLGALITAWIGGRLGAVAVSLGFIAMCVFVMLGRGAWANYLGFAAVYGAFQLLDVLISVCTNPLRMQLCDKLVSATQFTIYNSMANLPVAIGATLFVVLGGTGELVQVMLAAIALTLAGTAAFAWLRMPPGESETLSEEAYEKGLAPAVQ